VNAAEIRLFLSFSRMIESVKIIYFFGTLKKTRRRVRGFFQHKLCFYFLLCFVQAQKKYQKSKINHHIFNPFVV